MDRVYYLEGNVEYFLFTYTRAGAIYETCSECLRAYICAVVGHHEVTYQFPANLAYQRPPARGLKFRPRSTGGRFFVVRLWA